MRFQAQAWVASRAGGGHRKRARGASLLKAIAPAAFSSLGRSEVACPRPVMARNWGCAQFRSLSRATARHATRFRVLAGVAGGIGCFRGFLALTNCGWFGSFGGVSPPSRGWGLWFPPRSPAEGGTSPGEWRVTTRFPPMSADPNACGWGRLLGGGAPGFTKPWLG